MKRLAVSAVLRQRHEVTKLRWQHFIEEACITTTDIPPDIRSSWQRIQNQPLAYRKDHIPLNDPYEVQYRWHESPIHIAAQYELGKLIDVVTEGEFVAAISNAAGELLWTCASRHMQTRAADEHFIAGSNWREQVVGTNAVGLSLMTRAPATVFSAEHYRSSLHEWVCYAAPIIHPKTGQLVGVLDLSSTWHKHTPLGQSAVADMARSIAQSLPTSLQTVKADLSVHFLGQPQVILHGKALKLSLRHCEIIGLLILNPQGLSLDALHAALYGDLCITKSTLKSEISTLRTLLGGKIASRPYRLTLSVWADFMALWEALRHKKTDQAYLLYQGGLLIASNSPEIEQWRYCIDAVMSKTLETCADLDTLIQQCHLDAGELVRARLLDLANANN